MSDIDPILLIVITAVISFVLGSLIVWLVTRKSNKSREQSAEAKAQSIIKEAESKAEVMMKDKELKAKERFYQLKSEHEKLIAEKDKNISIAESRIKQK